LRTKLNWFNEGSITVYIDFKFQTTEETIMELTNKTILITGGASGIGFALAKALVARQNQVIICGRSQQKLDAAKQQIPALEIVRCDINQPAHLNDLLSLFSSKYPQLDVLINNAGIQQQLNLTSKPNDNAVNHEISTNFNAQIAITHKLYSLISSAQDPLIVFIGSVLGIAPKHEVPVYSATKAALHSYVQSIRSQSKQDRVEVVEVFPDVVDTPMTHHRHNEYKMNTDRFASQVLNQLQKGHNEIFIGRAKALSVIHQLAPTLASKIINKPATATK
jgi:uncharacterized oxidoreductase